MVSNELAYIGTDGDTFRVYVNQQQVGAFDTEAEATGFMAAVDQFRSTIADVETDGLNSIHERIHTLEVDELTDTVRLAHDLIEIALAERQVVAGVPGDPDDKLAALQAGVAKSAPARYTLGPVYVPGVPDGHDETIDADTLQKSIWQWVQDGDRTIYLQHTDKPAGEMVEILTWPQQVTTGLTVDGVTKQHTFPEMTPFMGVIWEPWAWDLVDAGALRGYSIGGKARRVEVDLAD
jgi:hypothetical protein